MDEPSFEWDEAKNTLNLRKHGVSFYEAQHAFLDPRRVIASDEPIARESRDITALARTPRVRIF